MDRQMFIVFTLGILSVYRAHGVTYLENPCPSGSYPIRKEHCGRPTGFLPCPEGSFCSPASEGVDPVCCTITCKYGLPLLDVDGKYVQCGETSCPSRSFCTALNQNLQICCPKKNWWLKKQEANWTK